MVLNVSGNSLKSLADLRDLDAVTHLFASDNQLSDVSDLAELLATLPSLWRLELIGNPVRQKAKYKDTVIISCRRLCKERCAVGVFVGLKAFSAVWLVGVDIFTPPIFLCVDAIAACCFFFLEDGRTLAAMLSFGRVKFGAF